MSIPADLPPDSLPALAGNPSYDSFSPTTLSSFDVPGICGLYNITLPATLAHTFRLVGQSTGEISGLPHLGTVTALLTDGITLYVKLNPHVKSDFTSGLQVFKCNASNFTGILESPNQHAKRASVGGFIRFAMAKAKKSTNPRVSRDLTTKEVSELADKWI